MLAAYSNNYWWDPTLPAEAVRGGKGNPLPFANGPLTFYNDRTLQYQSRRPGNLYGTLGAIGPNDFSIVAIAEGLTKAVPATVGATSAFRSLQSALNQAAARFGLPQRLKVTAEIDPATAELALAIAQRMPAKVRAERPSIGRLAQLLEQNPATAMQNAVPLLAISAEDMGVQFRSITPAEAKAAGVGGAWGIAAILGSAALVTFLFVKARDW